MFLGTMAGTRGKKKLDNPARHKNDPKQSTASQVTKNQLNQKSCPPFGLGLSHEKQETNHTMTFRIRLSSSAQGKLGPPPHYLWP